MNRIHCRNCSEAQVVTLINPKTADEWKLSVTDNKTKHKPPTMHIYTVLTDELCTSSVCD